MRASRKDYNTAYCAARRPVRRQEINEQFKEPVCTGTVISSNLYARLKEAGRISVFLQPPPEVLTWVSRLPASERDEIVLIGLSVAIRQTRSMLKTGGVNARARANTAKTEKNRVRIGKARAFDRVVEKLDHERVGDKLLGDCTKADLLRAAVSAEQIAGQMTINAAFYRLMADLVPQGQTVRQSNKRGDIVALLTTTFKEPE